ncbi:MAG: lysine--tRNA ligase, partial [Pseudomonadota bacterium]
YVLFETGYGPSGLPHIGTFGEVARTAMVRHAFANISDMPTKLFCVSDDMDGFRKVPENLPNQKMLTEHLGKPLSMIPDPYEQYESYGAYMNNKLKNFLDDFGFEYEFRSATECYKQGVYNEKLLKLLENYDNIMKIMLPTLGEDRKKTYSPFLPICQKTGKVLYVPMESVNTTKGTVSFYDEDNELIEQLVTDGFCKMQWKPDMGMRWAAFDVDFEMYGKDHLASAPLYTKICHQAGGKGPHQYKYELFLDANGQKISKSKGNGISIEEWLKYAPTDSLSLFMYQKPNKEKRLSFDVIPKQMDEYLQYLNSYSKQNEQERIDNPVWHIHNGNPPVMKDNSLSFSLLLNLASACNAENKDVLWGFIKKYLKDANPTDYPLIDQMTKYAVNYYHDFIKPNKKYRDATEHEQPALLKLQEMLQEFKDNDFTDPTAAEDVQSAIYAIGKEFNFDPLRDWFKALYQILLGVDQGPRFGSFVALYGVEQTIYLINKRLGNS